MTASTRHKSHDKYKSRIEGLLLSYSNEDASPETLAHNAKYVAVLVSGYLEQAVKELLLAFAKTGSRVQISRYIEESWPTSKNMNTNNIEEILGQFDTLWAEKFLLWLEKVDSRKGDINSIVKWRNNIAHGQEAKTNGVTLVSVKSKFQTVKELVNFLEKDLFKN